MSKFIVSTLTADNRYTGWTKSGGVNTAARSVLVKGGAGIALIGGGKDVATPTGVQTEVSDEDHAFLMAHPQFMEHVRLGFIRVANSSQVPDKAARSMETDPSRPRTDKDVVEVNKKAAGAGQDAPTLGVTTNKK
jgi:hypothetical protein